MVVVELADFGADGEPRRDGKPNARHLGKVRTFSAEDIPHLRRTVRLPVSEEVHVLCFSDMNCSFLMTIS